MKTIFKYELRPVDQQEVLMPHGAKLRSVGVQSGRMMLWAEVDTEKPAEARTIHIVGTGNPIPPLAAAVEFIGTVQVPPFVWHVYYEPTLAELLSTIL